MRSKAGYGVKADLLLASHTTIYYRTAPLFPYDSQIFPPPRVARLLFCFTVLSPAIGGNFIYCVALQLVAVFVCGSVGFGDMMVRDW